MKKRVTALFMALMLAGTTISGACAEEILTEEISTATENVMGIDESCEDADKIEKADDADSIIELEETADTEEAHSVDAISSSERTSLEILEIEPVEQSADTLLAAEEEIFTVEMEGELDRTGHSTDAAMVLLRTLREENFTDCYGSQLNGNAKFVYDSMVENYVTQGKVGAYTIDFSEAITFVTLGTTNGSGGLDWNSSDNAEYQQKINYIMQAAYDAFIYDYPEIFWMSTFRYGLKISFSGGNGSYTGSVSQIRLIPSESYEGSSEEIAVFRSSVNQTVDNLGISGTASREEGVKIIHDYLCSVLTYGNNSETWAHSAAGVFLKGGTVVCEGYAKAFKLLCDRFEIPCILVVGDAGGGHMWNYVQMEDGNWYLVDVTWDDQQSQTQDAYLLAGSDSLGFKELISAERRVYTNFSGAIYTKYFTLPTLSSSGYEGTEDHRHSWTVVEEKEPTCYSEGYCLSRCTQCGEETSVLLEKTEHRFEKQNYVDNKDATCTTDGTRTLLCDYGCGTKSGKIVVAGSAKGHSFKKYVSDQNATFSKNGTKTAKCANGCGATKTVTDNNTKVTLNAAFLRLKKGQSTTALKVLGLPKGMKVTSWKSSNTKIAKVNKNGKITAQKKNGLAQITIKISNGTISDTIKIPVRVQGTAVKAEKITVSPGRVTVKKGGKQKLTVTRNPITCVQRITYTSSRKNIAAVTSKGVITGKKAGTAWITVKCGSLKKKIKVTVTAR